MATQEQLLTADTFWEVYAGQPYELVRGRIIELAPTGGDHGAAASRAITRLTIFVDDHDLGEVFSSETGFRLSEQDVRGADAAFVTKARWQSVTETQKYVPFAPDLAIEVVSPNDSASAVQDKVDAYLDAGTRLVSVMYPQSRKIVAHYHDRTAKTFFEDDLIDGGDVLPGFQITVRDLFPPKRNVT